MSPEEQYADDVRRVFTEEQAFQQKWMNTFSERLFDTQAEAQADADEHMSEMLTKMRCLHRWRSHE